MLETNNIKLVERVYINKFRNYYRIDLSELNLMCGG